ncbi:PQQ-binding-like beta-propeller repeat protein [Chryseolinea sp. H1M3-3]|uniref:outer membrane protein assembly factor BamB family protein n=1 Tax=Chryseolinea sp. H1M3-3 TaxID=3034144 RepID=UPI0023EBBF42|nr:PQQ-binding-like beta-propeller repeat protein [Chryseolinea sp. H1M3-3]
MVSNDNLHAQNSWSTTYKGIGTFSSPRVTDVTGDGVGDVIVGAGREEFQACDSAVIAIDGRNGKMLWHVKAKDQIFGSAALKDLTGDGVNDVIINGRSAEFMAINGKTGKVIWRFDKKANKQKWWGFYNAQFIKDQNNDGVDDILTSNGGNVWAAPHETKDRPPGHLVVVSAKDGKLIAQASSPDKCEIYMSVSAIPAGDDYNIIFGTGGETVGGHLYVTKLSAVLKGDISDAVLLDSSQKNGYIAPAIWIDINRDNLPDIVANAVEGKLIAFDGSTYKSIWSVKIPNTEAYSSIAPGFFTADSIPDFFVSYALGVWPKLEWSRQLMVNGATGKTEFMDSLGFYQTSTPVVVDLDGDGRDEALLSVNIHIYDDYNRRTLNNMLVSVNFKTNKVNQFTGTQKGGNISTTPWIGDMDSDGFLDIVYCHGTNLRKSYTFDGMQIHRISTHVPIKKKINWGSYMGSYYDGVYHKEDDIR